MRGMAVSRLLITEAGAVRGADDGGGGAGRAPPGRHPVPRH